MKMENEKLEKFEWDGGDLDLFGESGDTTTVLTAEEKEALTNVKEEKEVEEKKKSEEIEKKVDKETKKEPITEETETEKEKEKETEKEEKKEKFFEEKPKETKSEEPDDFYTTLAKELKEKGVLSNIEIPESDITEEDFISLQEAEIDKRIEDTFEGFFEELDDDAKAFLKYKKDGGNTKEFFETLNNTTKYPSGDIENEDFQKEILKFYYKEVEELDDEDISDRIEWADENGKLEKYAQKYSVKLEKKQQAEKDAIINKASIENQKREKDRELFQKELKDSLSKIDNVNEFPIVEKEKKELYEYITKPTIKVSKNKYLTGLQKDLQDTTSDYKSLILLAKLMKNKFDISDLTKKIQTKQTQSIKNKLQHTKRSSIITGTKSSGKKSLSDFFN